MARNERLTCLRKAAAPMKDLLVSVCQLLLRWGCSPGVSVHPDCTL
jgi:hypothetical protein